MIIILEGADGSGKSTLAKKFAVQLGYEIIKMDKPNKDELMGQFDYYKRLLTLKDDVILDRSWYSEIVYGTVMPDRPKSYISMEQCVELEKICKDKAMLIHCTASVEKLWERCNSRGEEYVKNLPQMLKIKAAYDELFKECPLTMLTYEIKEK